MKKSICLLPLAFGTFGLGLTEYGMMGILPDVAKTMKVTLFYFYKKYECA